jgi:DNA gyrase/topoisomerase IV subunit A
MWTTEKVKQDLPTVRIAVQKGKIRNGYLTGKDSKFATVHIPIRAKDCIVSSVVFQVNWDTVTRCLNENKPVIY